MRQDQYEKLQELATDIADVAIFDADPKNWIGAGTAAKDLTKDERGDAYWCRKLAVSSLSVLLRIQGVIGQLELSGAGTKPAEDDSEGRELDAEVRHAEREAEKLLASLSLRSEAKAEFDKRAVGK